MPGSVARLGYETAAKDAAWKVLPIVIADMDIGEIVYVSDSAAVMFGWETGELLGQNVEVLVPADVQASHRTWRQDVSVPKTRLMGAGRQMRGLRRDGSEFPVHIGLTGVQVLDRNLGIAFVIDLSGMLHEPPAEWAPPQNPEPPPAPAPSPGVSLGTFLLLVLTTAALVLVLFFSCRIIIGSESATANDRLVAAIGDMQERRYDSAAELFAQAAKGGADATLSLGGRAECLYYLGKFDESLSVCRELAERVPNSGRAAYVRGLVKLKQGDANQAAGYFRSAAQRGERAALTLLPRSK